MAIVASETNNKQSAVPEVVICVDGGAVARLAPILRHLCVGLVDQAVRIRLLSSNPQVKTLSLGPVQAVIHAPLRWPATRRRLERVVEALSPRSPMVIHAFSAESYGLVQALADEFDVDPVLTVSSIADCEALAARTGARPAQLIASSAPLREILTDQLNIPAQRVVMIRPGVLAQKEAACFAREGRSPTLLCTSPLNRDRRVEVFVRTVALLRDRQCETLGFIVGNGRLEGALRNLVRRRDLSAVVTFAAERGRTETVMTGADVFVVPAPREAISVRLLQAMGTGMACVVAPNPVCDYVQDGQTAVVCPEATPESFANAIEQLLIDRATARRIAMGGLNYVKEHHTVSETARRTADLYRRRAYSQATYSLKP